MSQPVPLNARPRALRLPRAVTAAIATGFMLFVFSSMPATPAPDSFADLAETLLPSVVNISTTQVIRRGRGGNGFRSPQFPPGSPFEDFFRDFFDRNQPRGRPDGADGDGADEDANARRVTSLGSGFIIDAEAGLIVTNDHVIAEAEEVTVTLADGTDLIAEILGRDSKTDVAILKVVTDHPLPAVAFGDSTTARVGDWVMAIGNPYGLGGTVTVGIVSARGRNINAGPYDDFIQVDAPINRGNSGGPLFNMDGQVIGINTAIFSPSGGSVGIGFAIPSSLAEKIINDLIEYGEPRRGWLGVSIQPVTEEIAESLGLDKEAGALVADVVEGDPADKAGIIPGDVILLFNDREIETSRSLSRVVADTPINVSVPVVVWRDGERKKLQVMVGQMDEEPTQTASLSRSTRDPEIDEQVAVLGMVLSEISPNMREQLELSAEVSGVLITEVQTNSNAEEVGVRRGDIIVEAAQVKVSDPKSVEEQIAKVRDANRKSVLLGLQRVGRGFIYIAVKLENG